MKKTALLAVMVLFACHSFAQILIGKDASENGKFTVKESLTDLSVSQTFSFLEAKDTLMGGERYCYLNMGENFVSAGKIAQADLPVFTYLIEVPFCEDVVIEETARGRRVFSLAKGIKVMPKQISRSKQNEEVPFQVNEGYYARNSFGASERVSIELMGVMNGVRLAKLTVSPLRYNPVENKIEFVEGLDYTIKFVNPDYAKSLSLRKKTGRRFADFVSGRTMNPKNVSASVNASNVRRPYKMVMVSDRMFEQAIEPFIKWKTQQGFEVVTAYTDSIGTSRTEIKNYLQALWDNATEENPAADYLLLCGDVAQIPAFDGNYASYGDSHPTDLYYAEYTGDILPDVFYGRFSASTVEQMQAIVAKTVSYEKYEFADDAFLDKILLVAGVETNSPAPTCVNGQMNYVKQYFEGLDTLVYYNPSSGNHVSEVKEKLNLGQGWVNYSAHCDEKGWYSPSFLVSDVRSMTNTGKYGFFINNCCLSSKYDEAECYAEKLLRAEDKAAVAVIGGSDYTYWYEDFYWSVGAKTPTLNPAYDGNMLGSYDRMFHTNGESFDKWYVTAGQMTQAGNLAVELSNSDRKEYYWEVYTLMGDPSLMPYAGRADSFDVVIPEAWPIGANSLSLENLPAYTYVALSIDDVLIAAAQADANGSLLLEFEALTEVGEMKVVMSKQFYRPFIGSIDVVVLDEPYLKLSDITFKDTETGMIVDKLQADKQYSISMQGQNIGTQALRNATIRLELPDSTYMTSNDRYQVGNVNAEQIVELDGLFTIKTYAALVDKLPLAFTLHIEGEDYDKSITVRKQITAPVLDIKSINVQTQEESGLKRIDFTLSNTGSLNAQEGVASIESRNSAISIEGNMEENVSAISSGDTWSGSFFCRTEENGEMQFAIDYTAGGYSIKKVFTVDMTSRIEDFESGTFAQQWQNDVNFPWIIDSSAAHGGLLSAHSAQISHRQSSVLAISSNVVSDDSISFYVKVSSEKNYDFFKFYIDGVEKVSLSGNTSSAWKYKSFPVSAGEHTFKFEYVKDYSGSDGSDAAWIDDVKLPLQGSCVGLGTIIADNIVLAPNPSDKQTSISGLEGNTKIFLFDVNGRKIQEIRTASSSTVINTENLPVGTYYICIETNNNLITKKLIIAR